MSFLEFVLGVCALVSPQAADGVQGKKQPSIRRLNFRQNCCGNHSLHLNFLKQTLGEGKIDIFKAQGRKSELNPAALLASCPSIFGKESLVGLYFKIRPVTDRERGP